MQPPTSSTNATPKSATPPHGQGGTALAPHSEHLIRLRAKGKSNGEILSWLHTQGVSSTLAEIAAFWQHHAAQQQNRQTHSVAGRVPPRGESETPVEGNRPTIEMRPGTQDGQCGLAPAPAPSRTDPKHCPCGLAHGQCGLAHLQSMMEKYKRILDKQIDRLDADPNPDPENVKLIDRMLRTVMLYDQAQDRKQERKEALELKKADHELKAQKAATAAESPAKAESGEAQPFPKDFDNTEFIKVMRDEYFKDANTPEMKALVEKMLMEADRQAIAAGIKFVPYVPSGPPPPKPSG